MHTFLAILTSVQPRCLVLAALTILTTACGRFANSPSTDLDHNPDYLRARQAAAAGDNRVAAAEYLKVLRALPEAARAHLELGLLYDEKLNDPLAALYHYRQFLELEPNSERRQVVEGFMERAKLASAARLPSGTEAGDLARLQTEKAGLMQENAALRARVLELENGATQSPVSPPAAVVTQVVAVAPPVVPPGPAVMRTHTVQPKDTLQSIALKYYGTRSGWEKIYAANRAILASKDQLKVGQQLTIP